MADFEPVQNPKHNITCQTHPRLTTEIVSALKKQQIHTIINFINTPPEKLAKITNLTYKNILLIRKNIVDKHSAAPINAYDSYLNSICNTALISTGIKCVDELLTGGLLTGNVYEICGPSGCGKTQLCFTIVANVVQKYKQIVYYIDTKRDFNVNRLLQIINSHHSHSQATLTECLQRVHIREVHVLNDLLNALNVEEFFTGDNLRVVIVDTLASVFLPLTSLEHKLGYLNHTASVIKSIAKRLHIAVVVVNSVSCWTDDGLRERVANLHTPTLGTYWQPVPNVRLLITKEDLESEQRKITLLKSSKSKRNSQVVVTLDEKGVH